MRRSGPGLVAVLVALSAILVTVAPTRAETPRRGGELVFAVAAEPPSFDGHRESTFAVVHPLAPHYSTLLRFDPEHYPHVVGDVAESWTVSTDGLTYRFKLRRGIRFHDGSPLAAADVKATYDKIIFPGEGVASPRKATYAAVQAIEAPDPSTVVFRLNRPAASFLANLASPWNFIYKAEILARDPHWYEKNVMGSGPFKFVEYVRGSHWLGKRNDDYFVKGQPYLDGFRAQFIKDGAARVAAVRAGRVMAEFRGISPAERDTLVGALGDRIVIHEGPVLTALTVAINTERKPFDDPRVRRALTLGFDRWEASRVLSRIAFVKGVGGLHRPGSEWAMPESQLTKVAGFGKDIEAARKEARRLLKEAGVPDGFEITLLNRNIAMPYEPTAVFLIDQWRKVGLNVKQAVLESGQYFNALRGGSYELAIDFVADFMDEPDLQLFKFISRDQSVVNYGRYTDRTLDELYAKQSRATNAAERKRLVWEFERIVLDEKAYQFPTLWWERIIPLSPRVKGWRLLPSTFLNQDLRDVWLTAD